MMDFIKNLQQKPVEFRMRVLWLTTVVLGVIIFAAWMFGLKQEFKYSDRQSILGSNVQTSQTSSTHYITVEAADIVDGKFLLYFYTKNDTHDILNFSRSENISLIVNNKEYKP